MKRAGLLFACLLLPLGLAGSARAATVAILRPASPSPAIAETVARLRAELATVGIAVRMADRPWDSDRRDQAGRVWLARGQGAVDAVIDILGEEAPIAVEVVIAGNHTRRYEVSRVTLDPVAGNIPEKLAIRAIEILRANLIEMDLAARRPAETPPAGAEAAPPIGERARAGDEVDAPADRFTLEAGGAMLLGLQGVGPALMPLLRAGFAGPRIGVQAAVAGMGSRPRLTRGSDEARVAQGYGLLGASLRPRQVGPWWPYVVVAAGVLRTSLEGQAASPREGHGVTQWSFLLDAGVGGARRLGGRYYFGLEAHAQLATPYVAVHFADTVVATAGRPTLQLSLTLGAWL